MKHDNKVARKPKHYIFSPFALPPRFPESVWLRTLFDANNYEYSDSTYVLSSVLNIFLALSLPVLPTFEEVLFSFPRNRGGN